MTKSYFLPTSRPSTPVSLADVILRSAETWPDDEALILPDERHTYRSIADRAWHIALGLSALGVKPGENVGILMTNSADFVVSVFGIAMLGAVAVPINNRYRSWEIGFIAKDCDLRAIITHDKAKDYTDYADLLADALPALKEARNPIALSVEAAPALGAVVLLGGAERNGFVGEKVFDDLAAKADEARVRNWCEGVSAASIAAIIYTSGTTSQPRGAMLSQEALVRHWTMAGFRWGVKPGVKFWDPCPLFHIAGIGPLVFTLALGGTFVTDTHFEAGKALDLISAEKPNMLYPTYPPLTMDLVSHPKFETTDFSQTIAWLNVAPPETLRRMQAAIPNAAQVTLYGSTEGGYVTMTSPEDDYETRMTTGGLPMPGVEVRVVDPETGSEMPQGSAGEIRYRGYNTLRGYYKDTEKTAATLNGDGWVHTGDIGDFDTSGRLTFRGRLKDMLKVGGENVAPAEVEQFLEGHPAVKLAQVVGIPDTRLVEVPVAFVELHEGRSVTEAELVAFCKGTIASFKVPRVVRIVSDWPMSATKIQRGKLREDILAELVAKA
ncbi:MULTISPECIES: class I adenylate-forming enzyme family protein [unclassified Chelatococcus]|uniref:class I adenylate-forming enzyme family protein n=1 Tax=unclassified Chelatococcus TaxID=2638111 RepID=UPI001BCF1A0A|nr:MULTISPECIES: class I adenylate-forming enzyme family protein [unclassified Chelatococcus]MBS7743431.1 acyl--CoA ligase [Chelatococcus sp. HY11]MBX3547192.1 acyl--CoA ligase [Chelatococcus sp.]CAH1663879.1 Fatty-acyl-CoA synthase [Hyphomicrobiales bacterium]CAH1687957.1 Fatty-acyl-CoA synthase [Hyphomicrobiales bacterium]